MLINYPSAVLLAGQNVKESPSKICPKSPPQHYAFVIPDKTKMRWKEASSDNSHRTQMRLFWWRRSHSAVTSAQKLACSSHNHCSANIVGLLLWNLYCYAVKEPLVLLFEDVMPGVEMAKQAKLSHSRLSLRDDRVHCRLDCSSCQITLPLNSNFQFLLQEYTIAHVVCNIGLLGFTAYCWKHNEIMETRPTVKFI